MVSGSVMLCPYCGSSQSDEDYRDEEKWECQSCGKKFKVKAEYERTYCTEEIK